MFVNNKLAKIRRKNAQTSQQAACASIWFLPFQFWLVWRIFVKCCLLLLLATLFSYFQNKHFFLALLFFDQPIANGKYGIFVLYKKWKSNIKSLFHNSWQLFTSILFSISIYNSSSFHCCFFPHLIGLSLIDKFVIYPHKVCKAFFLPIFVLPYQNTMTIFNVIMCRQNFTCLFKLNQKFIFCPIQRFATVFKRIKLSNRHNKTEFQKRNKRE